MPARLLALALTLALAACGSGGSTPPDDVVARVGDVAFTEADLADALGDVPAGLDSVTAREQVVEQWVQRELLVQEAHRQGLAESPEVRRLLAESERSTLEAAALEQFFASNPAEPDEHALRTYYDEHRDALALREPYVRLRHLRTGPRERAVQAQQALARALLTPAPDSLFALVAREFADDPDGATALADEYVPESRLEGVDPALAERVAALPAGAQVAVVPSGQGFHVVQVVDRVPAGTVPPFSLVRAELAERLAVQMRREMEARLLRQLRSEARASGRLDIR